MKVLRIDTSRNYCDFLRTLLKEEHNRKVFSSSRKEALDQYFRLQAIQQFKLDNDKLKRAMAEVNLDLNIVRPR